MTSNKTCFYGHSKLTTRKYSIICNGRQLTILLIFGISKCLWIFWLHFILFTDQVLADENLLFKVCVWSLTINAFILMFQIYDVGPSTKSQCAIVLTWALIIGIRGWMRQLSTYSSLHPSQSTKKKEFIRYKTHCCQSKFS